MMWPSQTFLLYNGSIVYMFKQETFKLVCTNCDNFNFKKDQTILIPAKYNYKCSKEINLLSSGRFFQKFFGKNEKNR